MTRFSTPEQLKESFGDYPCGEPDVPCSPLAGSSSSSSDTAWFACAGYCPPLEDAWWSTSPAPLSPWSSTDCGVGPDPLATWPASYSASSAASTCPDDPPSLLSSFAPDHLTFSYHSCPESGTHMPYGPLDSASGISYPASLGSDDSDLSRAATPYRTDRYSCESIRDSFDEYLDRPDAGWYSPQSPTD
jgi:hypothetical protein